MKKSCCVLDKCSLSSLNVLSYVFVKTCNKSVNLESYTAMRKAVKPAERGF